MKVSRKRLAILAVAIPVWAAAAFSLLSLHERLTRRPNIILITIDALRPDHLGAYGYRRATSPDIDRLAAEGTVFTDAVTTATWTITSFASIFTSTYPRVHTAMVTGNRVAPQIPLLAELLRKNGWSTAAFVNQPMLDSAAKGGFDRGFALFRSPYATAHPIGEAYRGDAELTGDAVRWLETERAKPFFLWLHYMNPHGPYTPPPPYDTMFEGDGLYRTGSRVPIGEDNFRFGHVWKEHAKFLGNSTDVDTYVAGYDGKIRFANDQVRAVLEAVERLGLARGSAIIVTADHGESMTENNWYFEHGMTFESIIRVPLIVRLPSPSPGRLGALVSLLDLAPTILALAGVAPPPTFEGKSLLTLIRGETAAVREYAFGESGHMEQQYVRTSRYKLAVKRRLPKWPKPGFYDDYFAGREEIVELFDIRSDPHEERNLAAEQPGILAALRAQLETWKAKQDEFARIMKIGPADRATLGGETEKQLRALGYLQ